jgi:RimK family alpha-L-glutamate ligase
MRKILVLRSSKSQKGKKLIKEINSRKNLQGQENLFSDLEFRFDKVKYSILVKGEPVENFNLVYIKIVGPYKEQFAILAEYLKKYQVLLVDNILATGNYYQIYKFSQMEKLSLAGLPYPKTYIGSSLSACKQFFNLKTDFILLAKNSLLDRGEGIFKVTSEKQLAEYLKKGYLIQEFLNEKTDLRILIVGNEVIGAIQRIPKENEFRANIACGGKARVYDLPEALRKLALKAAKVMGFEIAGVDLLINTEGKVYILEVNRSPQFKAFQQATGINVTAKIADFLEKKIRRHYCR